MIADLSMLGLTDEQKAKRKLGLGGSDANTLMSGNPEKIVRLWEEKCGLREGDDLSDILAVQMGNWTEPLNAAWYTKVTGRRVICRNQSIVHSTIPWWRSNLDGIAEREDNTEELWEAKHVGGREDVRTVVVPRYTPQIYHNMHAAELKRGVMSIFEGNSSHRIYEFRHDDAYLAVLIERETAFWECVTTKTPPPEWIDIAPPMPVTEFRSVSMEGVQEWAEAATIWLETKALAKVFEDVVKTIKEQVELDVGQASGHGIVVSRSKNGALTIREEKILNPKRRGRR